MATFGSTINPALGRVDYSPLMQGAGMASQGIMQGAQGMAQGISAGIERFQKNKEEEKAASAAIKTSETLIKGLRSLAEQKDDKGNPLIPQPMIAALDQFAGTVSDPSLSTRERAMIAKQGVQQFSGLLNAGMSAAQMRSALAQNAAQTDLYANQAKALADELATAERDNAALAKAITSVSGGGDILGSFVAAGGSMRGLQKLKDFLPKSTEPPAGYRKVSGGNLEMIPGGPADVAAKEREADNARQRELLDIQKKQLSLQERSEAAKEEEKVAKKKAEEEARQLSVEDAKLSAATTLQQITRAKELIDKPLAQGFGASVGGFFGGSPGADLENTYDVIRANEALSRIIALKKASPTGSTGFGALNLKELETLQSRFAKLTRQASDSSAKQALTDLETVLQKAFPDLKTNANSRDVRKKTGLGGAKTPAMPALPGGWSITK